MPNRHYQGVLRVLNTKDRWVHKTTHIFPAPKPRFMYLNISILFPTLQAKSPSFTLPVAQRPMLDLIHMLSLHMTTFLITVIPRTSCVRTFVRVSSPQGLRGNSWAFSTLMSVLLLDCRTLPPMLKGSVTWCNGQVLQVCFWFVGEVVVRQPVQVKFVLSFCHSTVYHNMSPKKNNSDSDTDTIKRN